MKWFSKVVTLFRQDVTRKLSDYFESIIEIPRMRHGKRQTVETLINEEALLFAKYVRDERETWIPRVEFLTRCCPSGRIAPRDLHHALHDRDNVSNNVN